MSKVIRVLFIGLLISALMFPTSTYASSGNTSNNNNNNSSQWSVSHLISKYFGDNEDKDDDKDDYKDDHKKDKEKEKEKDFKKWCKKNKYKCSPNDSYNIWKDWFCK